MGEGVQDSLDSIDATHGDGDLNAFNLGDLRDKPMKVTTSQSEKYLGEYSYARTLEEEGRAKALRLSKASDPSDASIANTFTHEVGHRLDNTTLAQKAAPADYIEQPSFMVGAPPRKTKRVTVPSDPLENGMLSPSGQNTFASTTSPDLEDWRKAVNESAPMNRLTDMHQNPKKYQRKKSYTMPEYSLPDGRVFPAVTKEYDWSVDMRYVRYLRDAPEGFARSYTQYVATRSNNTKMLDDLYKHAGKDVDYPTQWTAKEFEPIAKAFDELFEKIGWVEKAP